MLGRSGARVFRAGSYRMGGDQTEGRSTMRTTDQGAFTRYSFSARDTEDWATRPGAAWPCSALRGVAGWVVLDSVSGDRVDISSSWSDCPSDELDAFLADMTGK
jgi:hypothetical protein